MLIRVFPWFFRLQHLWLWSKLIPWSGFRECIFNFEGCESTYIGVNYIYVGFSHSDWATCSHIVVLLCFSVRHPSRLVEKSKSFVCHYNSIVKVRLLKLSEPLLGCEAGTYPWFNDMMRLRRCHSPEQDTSLMTATNLQLRRLKKPCLRAYHEVIWTPVRPLKPVDNALQW